MSIGFVRRSLLTQILTLIALAAPGPQRASASQTCESLAMLSLPNTTITSATSEPAGTFTPPSPFQQPSNVVAHCRVIGTIAASSDSQIGFEVWLPTANWNGKFQGVGNGGLAGEIVFTGPGSLADAVNRGYAGAGTDTGHVGGPADGAWAIDHPEKVIDNAYRAIHEMTLKGKAITAALYGATPTRSYFNGCSTGGRQALLEAQRYPTDYDAIIAGAPANFLALSHLLLRGLGSVWAPPKAYCSKTPATTHSRIISAAIRRSPIRSLDLSTTQ
jgi:hypothetical protein